MALVDPYSPCPCGSDKKFKWCCQKAEPYVERANRLAENGQFDAAVAVARRRAAQGPRKPLAAAAKSASRWSCSRSRRKPSGAVRSVLGSSPITWGRPSCRPGGLANEGPVAAAAAAPARASSTRTETHGPVWSRSWRSWPMSWASTTSIPPPCKHFELALTLDGSEQSQGRSAQQSLKANPLDLSLAEEPYTLASTAQRLAGPQREQFDGALTGPGRALGSPPPLSSSSPPIPSAGLAAEQISDSAGSGWATMRRPCAALRRWIDRAGPRPRPSIWPSSAR